MQHGAAVPLLSLVSILLCTGVLALYALRALRLGRARPARLSGAAGGALVPEVVVEAFYWAIQAPGRTLARLGADPDVLTYLALVVSLAALPLIASGRLAEGGVAVALGGCLDAVDGLVARLSGRASPAGAVLDAVLDRVADAAPFAGLAVVYRESAALMLVPLAALTASSLVSYARARSDALGLALPHGPMRRHERIGFLVVSLLLGPVWPAMSFAPGVPYPATLAGVGIIAGAGFVGAFLLVSRARAALGRGSKNSRTLPRAC